MCKRELYLTTKNFASNNQVAHPFQTTSVNNVLLKISFEFNLTKICNNMKCIERFLGGFHSSVRLNRSWCKRLCRAWVVPVARKYEALRSPKFHRRRKGEDFNPTLRYGVLWGLCYNVRKLRIKFYSTRSQVLICWNFGPSSLRRLNACLYECVRKGEREAVFPRPNSARDERRIYLELKSPSLPLQTIMDLASFSYPQNRS